MKLARIWPVRGQLARFQRGTISTFVVSITELLAGVVGIREAPRNWSGVLNK